MFVAAERVVIHGQNIIEAMLMMMTAAEAVVTPITL